MALPKTIRVQAGSVKLSGTDASMEWTIVCYKDRRSGPPTEHRIVLKCCRGGISELLEQIKAMHKRDRDHLAWQTKRIETEASILV